MTMTPTEKIVSLVDALNTIKSITTQPQVRETCVQALAGLHNHKKSRGRRKAIGKYESREELIRWVLFFYYTTDQNQSQVARTCGVSQYTVSRIISEHANDKQEWL